MKLAMKRLDVPLDGSITVYTISLGGYDYNTDSYNPWFRHYEFKKMGDAMRFQTALISLPWDTEHECTLDVANKYLASFLHETGNDYEYFDGHGALNKGDFALRRFTANGEMMSSEAIRIAKIDELLDVNES